MSALLALGFFGEAAFRAREPVFVRATGATCRFGAVFLAAVLDAAAVARVFARAAAGPVLTFGAVFLAAVLDAAAVARVFARAAEAPAGVYGFGLANSLDF